MINKTVMISWFHHQEKYTIEIEKIYDIDYVHDILFPFTFPMETNIKESLLVIIYD